MSCVPSMSAYAAIHTRICQHEDKPSTQVSQTIETAKGNVLEFLLNLVKKIHVAYPASFTLAQSLTSIFTSKLLIFMAVSVQSFSTTWLQ